MSFDTELLDAVSEALGTVTLMTGDTACYDLSIIARRAGTVTYRDALLQALADKKPAAYVKLMNEARNKPMMQRWSDFAIGRPNFAAAILAGACSVPSIIVAFTASAFWLQIFNGAMGVGMFVVMFLMHRYTLRMQRDQMLKHIRERLAS